MKIGGFIGKMQTITIAELRELINKKEQYILIDVREKSELQHGMIPTAKNIPLGEVEEALELEEPVFQKKYGFVKPKKSDNLIFHCRTGGRSAAATQIAAKLGFTARNYAGSIWEWADTDKNVKRYGPAP